MVRKPSLLSYAFGMGKPRPFFSELCFSLRGAPSDILDLLGMFEHLGVAVRLAKLATKA